MGKSMGRFGQIGSDNDLGIRHVEYQVAKVDLPNAAQSNHTGF
jgi:hypothetical protein